MRKAVLLSSISFFFISSILSQENKLGISISPALVTAPDLKVGVQAGVVFNIDDELSLLTEITYAGGDNPTYEAYDSRFIRIKPELRYSLSKGRNTDNYVAMQFSFAMRKWRSVNRSFYEKEAFADSIVTFSSAIIRSPFITSSVQIGKMLFAGQHFAFDFFMGIGARIVFTDYEEIRDQRKELAGRPICIPFFRITPAFRINDTETRFHMNMGMRVIYRL